MWYISSQAEQKFYNTRGEELKMWEIQGFRGNLWGPDLFPTLLAGDDGIVVTTEITLGRHCPGPSLSLAGPVLGWADLLIVRLQASPGGELEINLINNN